MPHPPEFDPITLAREHIQSGLAALEFVKAAGLEAANVQRARQAARAFRAAANDLDPEVLGPVTPQLTSLATAIAYRVAHSQRHRLYAGENEATNVAALEPIVLDLLRSKLAESMAKALEPANAGPLTAAAESQDGLSYRTALRHAFRNGMQFSDETEQDDPFSGEGMFAAFREEAAAIGHRAFEPEHAFKFYLASLGLRP